MNTNNDLGRRELKIRPATPADANQLSSFAYESFIQTYGSYNTEEDIAAYTSQNFGEAIQAAQIKSDDKKIVIAESGESILGYAQLGRGREPDCLTCKPAVELERIYVASEWHGRGLANRLLDVADESAVDWNAALLWLGVWENNPRAFRFYQKCNFEKVGVTNFQFGSSAQTDWVMQRAVSRR